jgi:hypothetical protein
MGGEDAGACVNARAYAPFVVAPGASARRRQKPDFLTPHNHTHTHTHPFSTPSTAATALCEPSEVALYSTSNLVLAVFLREML